MKQTTTTSSKAPDGAERSADQLVRWSLERFPHEKVVLTTGFGMEGCVLIDLYARHAVDFEVAYLDTGFFFAATHELIAQLRNRYPNLRFRDHGTRLTPAAQARRYGDRLWERSPDRCCELRKLRPMAAALAGAELWVTALRRGQSSSRTGLQILQFSRRYGLLKLNPLAMWSRQQIWQYVRCYGVPYNRLHDRGYPSIGCTHCTRPVEGAGPGDYSRAGRWHGSDKTECGLHT